MRLRKSLALRFLVRLPFCFLLFSALDGRSCRCKGVLRLGGNINASFVVRVQVLVHGSSFVRDAALILGAAKLMEPPLFGTLTAQVSIETRSNSIAAMANAAATVWETPVPTTVIAPSELRWSDEVRVNVTAQLQKLVNRKGFVSGTYVSFRVTADVSNGARPRGTFSCMCVCA